MIEATRHLLLGSFSALLLALAWGMIGKLVALVVQAAG